MQRNPARRRGALFFLLFFTGGLVFVYSQEIITAERYLSMVGAKYGGVKDYEANVYIKSGRTEMYGNLSFLSPSFLRIDFSKPAEQVIDFNGENLTVYLPDYRATLNQTVNREKRAGGAGAASLATPEGLNIMRRNYVPAFVTGPTPVPLDSDSQEKVVKLRLVRRTVSEGFREIIMSVDPQTMFIRRLEGTTIAGSKVQFDFTDIKINQGIPEQRFIYDSPASANNYNNFLFDDTN